MANYSNGSRKLRSFSGASVAIKEAKCVARLMRGGDAEGLKLTGSDRAVYVRAVEHLRSSGVALDVAADRFAEALILACR